mmetsp:Transcript_14068/g.19535  ORF Transcript_14068/g.19535 Transcript_14068/m.19535 type:complete len:102 (+) Transcript_14068:88-393(+)
MVSTLSSVHMIARSFISHPHALPMARNAPLFLIDGGGGKEGDAITAHPLVVSGAPPAAAASSRTCCSPEPPCRGFWFASRSCGLRSKHPAPPYLRDLGAVC